uniref:PYD and CARD domain containing n=1 Tax=Astyanax mexicanus TaxID=7994 RepID=A0A3B1KAW5_ASTMX
MSSSIRDLLLEALEDLDSQQFKAFTWKLTDSELDLRIPRGVVEGRDRVDIVNLLIGRFTENRALEITLQLLKIIRANQVAEDLETGARVRGLCAAGGDALKKAAFIDDKWAELVQRATGVEAVLDVLLSRRMINDEQYSEICSERIAQRMMQRLIREALRASGDSGKIVLYDVLMALQPYMMKDLGAS